jgi:hypothetical protein
MIEQSADFTPIWMLLSAAFGFLIGDTFGDQARHRRCLEESNTELRDRLEMAQPFPPDLHRTLEQQRKVINDIHKRVIAVSKGLGKSAS